MRILHRRMLMRLVFLSALGVTACAVAPADQNRGVPFPTPSSIEPTIETTIEPAIEPTPTPAIESTPAQVTAARAEMAAPTTTAMPETEPTATSVPDALLPNAPIAPLIQSDTWLNVEQPLLWDSLRGQVVMVDFWTFGCINCQHVYGQLKQTYADYKDRGFTIVSVHAPEFDYERDLNNVRAAVEREGIDYPVAIDNDFANWKRYRNRYWPAWYLVDKRGIIRFTHVGEGGDAETREWIETLLAE